MAASFFFYDLETSGLHPSEARVMQFAGQRTDENLNPVGDPVNVLIKLASDVLPSPEAVLLTGITPQQTLQDGLTEAEFLQFFYEEVVQPQTVFLGFNSVRFDDEFMRYLHYRNFYDPYEWQWYNDCSRWDILDLVRMTRALRPEGITWPFTDDGKPTNRLELLTKLNGLEHEHAHDALSDVYATINVTKLIRDKQPDLFKYLFECRNKKKVAKLVLAGQPFVYTSGRYPSDTLNTSVAVLLAKHPEEHSGIVFDLRFDPQVYANMSVDEIVAAWRYDPEAKPARKPVKTLKYNRCPAVAPLGVMNKSEIEARLQLTLATVRQHFKTLKAVQGVLAEKVLAAQKVLDAERAADYKQHPRSVDALMYDGFLAAGDKAMLATVRRTKPTELETIAPRLQDDRLKQLLPLYKARNYPRSLSTDERAEWDAHCAVALFNGGNNSRLAQYFERLKELKAQKDLTDNQRFLVEELQLYGESIMPSDADESQAE
ncbi:MAG: exodeoxyribonuclease I [Patescibacteria group bacterium]|nr:exodeoxyribonuclease I [Patescibacteria group bacterium]